ncbi:MAG: PKD domain-containing protein, partial [Thermoplasmata archaeon]
PRGGIYVVTVRVLDNDNAVAVRNFTVYVKLLPDFNIQGPAGDIYMDEVLSFNIISSVPATYYWDWDASDGINSIEATGEAVQHIYTRPGIYTITVNGSNTNGTLYKNITLNVRNRQPVANAGTDTSVYKYQSVLFDASATWDSPTDINNLTYQWDFGDSNYGAGRTAYHTYTQSGNYTVTLTVTDPDGSVSISTRRVTVINRAPVVVAPSSISGIPGTAIMFNATITDPDGDAINILWDFGTNTSNLNPTFYTFPAPTSLTVVLTVSDGDAGGTVVINIPVTILNRPPSVNISQTYMEVSIGTIVALTATATDPDGEVLNYTWNPGDGSGSQYGTAFIRSYTVIGSYNVTVIVRDTGGNTASAFCIVIVRNLVPTVSIAPTTLNVSVGSNVTFTAFASDPDGTIVLYTWTVTDGATPVSGANLSTFAHIFTKTGTYQVVLNVSDNYGGYNSTLATVQVNNNPPVIITGSLELNVTIGQQVNFTASASDPDGHGVYYLWNFGNYTSTSPSVSYTWTTTTGIYYVQLSVRDDYFAYTNVTYRVNVVNNPPIVTVPSTSIITPPNSSVQFIANVVEPDSHPTILTWSVGTSISHENPYNYTFTTTGTYSVLLNVSDSFGAYTTVSIRVDVVNNPPVVSLSQSIINTSINNSFTISAQASDPEGHELIYTWDFGDGTLLVTPGPVSHIYLVQGIFNITLTVRDAYGGTATAVAKANVFNNLPQITSEPPQIINGTLGKPVLFSVQAYDPEGLTINYTWNFGDGTEPAYTASVAHVFNAEGTYEVRLTVSDGSGGNEIRTILVNITNKAPQIQPISNMRVLVGEDIIFTASIVDEEPDLCRYEWVFGDSSTSNLTSPVRRYNTTGNYSVTITVTDYYGKSNTQSFYVEVYNTPPNIIFDISEITIVKKQRLNLTATATDPDGDKVNFIWSFGDGVTDVENNTTTSLKAHIFLVEGRYNITLTVIDIRGGSYTLIKTVNVLSPQVSFAGIGPGTIITVEPGNSATFRAAIPPEQMPAQGTYSLRWDFGDGTNATGESVSHKYEKEGTYDVTVTVMEGDTPVSPAYSAGTVKVEYPKVSDAVNGILVLLIALVVLLLLFGVVHFIVRPSSAVEEEEPVTPEEIPEEPVKPASADVKKPEEEKKEPETTQTTTADEPVKAAGEEKKETEEGKSEEEEEEEEKAEAREEEVKEEGKEEEKEEKAAEEPVKEEEKKEEEEEEEGKEEEKEEKAAEEPVKEEEKKEEEEGEEGKEEEKEEKAAEEPVKEEEKEKKEEEEEYYECPECGADMPVGALTCPKCGTEFEEEEEEEEDEEDASKEDKNLASEEAAKTNELLESLFSEGEDKDDEEEADEDEEEEEEDEEEEEKK